MEEFSGQWLGGFKGDREGSIILDLDFRKYWLEGSLYAFTNRDDEPNIFAPVVSSEKNDGDLVVKVGPQPLHPTQARVVAPDEFSLDGFPNELELRIGLVDGEAVGVWNTDQGQAGVLELTSSKADQPSMLDVDASVTDWDSFRERVSAMLEFPYSYVFRGQSSPWRLRTAFHRTRRKDLVRYFEEDVQRVRKASVALTGAVFDHANPDHNGAFMHLLQHHSYPTPMLDWSYSPYIAAFFAYSSFAERDPSRTEDTDVVRILMFDALSWKADFNQVLSITHCRPHLSFLEPLALENPRALPQQAVASMTNLDDIESYVAFREAENSKKYLTAFDLPRSQAGEVLRELSLMGISPGSLFPGIEGLCAEYRQRQFGYDL